MKRGKGYTLAEAAVVIVIALIMLAGVSYVISSIMGLAREERVLSETSSLGGLISQYKLEIGSYPENLNALTKANGQYGPWISDIPTDPLNKGNTYLYLHNDDGFLIYSPGSNGASESNLTKGISGDDIGFRGK